MSEQEFIQDVLKYLAECEYDQTCASADALSKKFSLPPARIERVIVDLRAAELIEPGSLVLTTTGREYAMHILRAHRLYETYLARRTGVPEADWHRRAEMAEHRFSESDVRKLSEELGNPRFDPHGDPIPSAAGDMPPHRGRPLVEQPVGWAGRVVHVEDEPARLYAQVAAASIAPGTVLRIECKADDEMRLRAEGRTFRFPMEVAGQIAVVDLDPGEQFDETIERLSALHVGEEAAIVGLSPLCRGLERNRLLDLGVVPGSSVSVDLVSASGSPVAYRLRGASIALRREQADRVRIRKAGS